MAIPTTSYYLYARHCALVRKHVRRQCLDAPVAKVEWVTACWAGADALEGAARVHGEETIAPLYRSSGSKGHIGGEDADE